MMAEPKKPAKDTVYVDVDDDITAIIDKMEAAKQKVVALVLPKRSSALQSIVNMRLLKRSAENAEKKAVLITAEPALLPLAGAAGLHVAKNLHSLPEVPPSPSDATPSAKADDEDEAGEPEDDGKPAKIDYEKPLGELAATHAVDEPETIALEDKETVAATKQVKKVPKNKRLKIPNFDSFRNRIGLVIAGLVALIIFFVIGGRVLPKATITLQTTGSPVSASINLTTSDKAKKLDLKSNTIPAQLKTTDQSSTQQVTATGEKNLGKKATGTVTMSAQDCSAPFATPADVPAGTGVVRDGLTYIAQNDTSFSISGATGSCVNYNANKTTTIKAQSGGENYNVSNADFSVSGRSDVEATGSANGGTDDTVTVLSQSDVDNAVKKLTGNDSKDLTDKFKKGLDDDGFYVLESTLKAGKAEVKATPAVGQQASTSSVAIKVTYSALVVDKDDLKKAITKALEKEIDTKHQKIASEDVLKDIDVEVQDQASSTVASLAVSLSTTALPNLDSEAIKKQIGGKEDGAIRSELGSLPGVKGVEVDFSPFWVSTAPKNTGKIHIIMQEITTSEKSAP